MKSKMKKEFEKLLEDNLNWKFWHSYCEADLLDRDEILEPIVKRMKSLIGTDISEEELNDRLTMSLKGYFDDLIEYLGVRGGER